MITILVQTLGGLGLFLLGMKMMTEGLEMTAGQKIKRILGAISSNRVIGCLTGAGVTAAIQSSSATTVMLIGFVGAGIMTFQQAVGVILGANIGTTITAQMIAFKLTELALPAIAIGVVLKFFSKRRKFRYIGEIILGFGLLFYGMTVMKDGLSPIKSDPEFIAFFMTFSTDSFGGLILCVGMGALVTIVVQSSSATVGLTMTLATQGLISFPTALALVLGENIGTTITAQLATLGSDNVDAIRTARAHAIFNIIGVCIILLVFPWFSQAVDLLTRVMGEGGPDQVVNGEYIYVSRAIANGHTLFNVINAMIFLIFLPRLVQVTILLSPKKRGKRERYRMPDFDRSFIDSPIGALARVRGELRQMAEFTHLNLLKVNQCITVRDDDTFGERDAVEEHIDALQKAITEYLISIYQGEISETEAQDISEMMRITNNLERIGDSLRSVSKTLERIHEQGTTFSTGAMEDLERIAAEAARFMELIMGELTSASDDLMIKAAAQEDLIDQMREEMRRDHIDRLRCGACVVDSGVLFIALLSNYEKMGDYCYNIATGISRIG